MSTDRDKAWKDAWLLVENFQDRHCRPDGITLKAGTKENLKIMVHAALSTARAEKTKELEPYCEHLESCKSNERYPSPPCDCGLARALTVTALEAAAKEQR